MHLRIVLAESVPQARIPQCYEVLDVPEHLFVFLTLFWGAEKKNHAAVS
jgi:hypothetical protein